MNISIINDNAEHFWGGRELYKWMHVRWTFHIIFNSEILRDPDVTLYLKLKPLLIKWSSQKFAIYNASSLAVKIADTKKKKIKIKNRLNNNSNKNAKINVQLAKIIKIIKGRWWNDATDVWLMGHCLVRPNCELQSIRFWDGERSNRERKKDRQNDSHKLCAKSFYSI